MSDQGFDLALLSRLGMPERTFKAGETIFREGEAAHELFVIKKGRVEIRFDGRVLDELGENDLFGEMALVEQAPRSATAVATTEVALAPIAEKQFLFLVHETP